MLNGPPVSGTAALMTSFSIGAIPRGFPSRFERSTMGGIRVAQGRAMASNPELETWNGRFSQPGFVFGTEPNAFLAAQAARLKPGQKALAVADGEGRNG